MTSEVVSKSWPILESMFSETENYSMGTPSESVIIRLIPSPVL